MNAPPPTTTTLTIRLVARARLEERGPARFLLRTPLGDLRLVVPSAGLGEAFRRLIDTGADPLELQRLVVERDGSEAGEILRETLDRMEQRGLLCRRIWSRGRAWITAEPIAPGWRGAPSPAVDEVRAVLSRFAFARSHGRRIVLESPLSHMRLILHDGSATQFLPALSTPWTPEELARRVPDVEPEAVRRLPGLLRSAGMLSPVDDGGTSLEESDPTLRLWEFHDLLFHARSRQGRHAEPYGGTYRFRGIVDPLPARRSRGAAETVELPRPDLAALTRGDAPFTTVLEQRRTLRRQATRPLSAGQLGEFLYRASAVRHVDREGIYETVRGVSPTSGGSGELELYPAIDRCEGIAPGLYAYDGHEHRLVRLSGLTLDVERLLDGAGRASAGPRPQVLIVVAARFQRAAWKYASVSYANVLKDVGALFQTMYLVATSMGLAACAIGGGDSDRFARAAGTDYLAETSVGEFMLGRAPESSDAQ